MGTSHRSFSFTTPYPLADDNYVPANTTAVAIDRDKNSPHAVRWAIDRLVISNSLIILIHVRLKNHHDEEESDYDINQLFIPFRGYCARKGMQIKEVVLEDTTVAKAILDYVSRNLVNSLVVGASTRNPIASYLSYKKFKHDVPSSLMKSAPDFCCVYVISKGKIFSVRTAQRTVANTALPPRSSSLPPQNQIEDDGSREQYSRGGLKSVGSGTLSMDSPVKLPVRDRDRHKSSPANLSMDSIDFCIQGQSSHDLILNEPDFSANLGYGSMDIPIQNLDFSMVSASSMDSVSQSSRDIDAEMRRLRLELKQTMDLYSTACKEALIAKKKADELHQWKVEKDRKFEEARLAEEAALAIAEMEKAKCQAAIEAAEAAQKRAEMEALRRRQAELKAKKEADERQRAMTVLAHNDVRYRKYTIEEIEEATENFSQSKKIGEGGYGPVYKGKLDHTPVAIKVLRPDVAQGQKQFQQEVEVLCCIRHPNMVLLLGACPEYGCLVYEYMSHGSLEDRLFRRDNTPPISWRKRFQISAEIATALLFLHQAKPEPLVHRDLKPANVLLDRNYVSKISDVGLARLVPPPVADNVTQYHMTSAAGTFCYIDPEYQQTCMLTTKSDIYSLGIMLLQIITAKPPMGLAHHVERAIDEGTFADMLDPAVPDWPIEEALSFAWLSLKCCELRKRDRPDLGTVIVPELNRLRNIGRSSNSNSHGYNGYSQGHNRGHSLGYGHGNRSSTQHQRHSDGGSTYSHTKDSIMSPFSRSRVSSTSKETMNMKTQQDSNSKENINGLDLIEELKEKQHCK